MRWRERLAGGLLLVVVVPLPLVPLPLVPLPLVPLLDGCWRLPTEMSITEKMTR